jgi:alkylation response protein AidB-like acyl-CoA dehydrogenase
MILLGSRFTAEQLEVIGLVKDVVSAVPDGPGTARPEATAAKYEALVESGLWSIGMDEQAGGGGAPLELRLAALMQLGSRWAGLAWGCAQAHAAVEVLLERPQFAHLASEIAEGSAGITVVDLDSESVWLERDGDTLTGSFSRLDLARDPQAGNPSVLILAGTDHAYLLPPHVLEQLQPVRTTGLEELHTVQAHVQTRFESENLLAGVPVEQIRARLDLAGAAVAAGLAAEAADQADQYARTRVQFGAPLVQIPMVRAALAAQAGDAGTSIAEVLQADGQSVTRAAAALRGNCERAISVCAAALQSHGGYGYLREFGIEGLLRDAISLRAAAGVLASTRRTSRAWEPPGSAEAVPFFVQEELKV